MLQRIMCMPASIIFASTSGYQDFGPTVHMISVFHGESLVSAMSSYFAIASSSSVHNCWRDSKSVAFYKYTATRSWR